MSNFKELMLLAAAVMDEDELINRIRKSIRDYDAVSVTDKQGRAETLEIIQMDCALLMTKKLAPTVDDAMSLSKEMKAMDDMAKFFKGDGLQN